MASGITHMLLAKKLHEYISDFDLKSILTSQKAFLTVGAVAPDLPYASIADNNFIFRNEGELADKFHYEKTNQVVLFALKEIKSKYDGTELDALFCFFTGFALHIIGDGIIHPFVRDVVGDYNSNKTGHRILEMKLDAIYLDSLAHTDVVDSGLPDILEDIFDHPERERVFEVFSNAIRDTYGDDYDIDIIAGWIEGLHRMFSLAASPVTAIFKNFSIINTFLEPARKDVQIEETCTLKKPVDRDENFLKVPVVHYMDDCIPHFFNTAVPVVQKIYEYVYNNGQELTADDLYPVDLDTGRLLSDNNDLDKIPKFWT